MNTLINRLYKVAKIYEAVNAPGMRGYFLSFMTALSALFPYHQASAQNTCTKPIAWIHTSDNYTSPNRRGITAWASKGDGTFSSQDISYNGDFSRFANSAETGTFGEGEVQATFFEDVTGDGLADIVHIYETNAGTTGEVTVYKNLDNNTWSIFPIVTANMQFVSALAAAERFPGVTCLQSTLLADVNGDGKKDIVFSPNNYRVYVWQGNGDGTFSVNFINSELFNADIVYRTSGNCSTDNAMMGDVNGDGRADYVFAHERLEGVVVSGDIRVWLGKADGSIGPERHSFVRLGDTGASNSVGIGSGEYGTLADADGDGDLDYCYADGVDGNADIWIFRNDGTGNFSASAVRTTVTPPPGGIGYFANYALNEQSFFADVNYDGKADFVTGTAVAGNNADEGITVYLATSGGSYSTAGVFTPINQGGNQFQAGLNGSFTRSYLTCGGVRASFLETSAAAAGTIDCSKTQLQPAPVSGVAGQTTLKVTINVTTPGCFTNLSVSGSGFSLANGVTQICTTTTGVQTFSIPVFYNGTTPLGTLAFSMGAAGNCSADLTRTPKQAIVDTWTLECVPTDGPSFK